MHGGDGPQYTSQMVAVQEVVDKSEERRVAGQVAFGSFAKLLRQQRVAGKLATARVNHFPFSSITLIISPLHHLPRRPSVEERFSVFVSSLFIFFPCFSSFFLPSPLCHFATQDWVSISVGGANRVSVAPLPEPLMELQRRSSCLRQQIVGANGREAGCHGHGTET